MENIYCKILDIFFCSMIYTACHDYNCLLVLGCLLNAMIILCCNSFFLFNLQKMPVRGLHKISFLSRTRLWIYLNLFFWSESCHSFTSTYEFAYTYSVSTYIYLHTNCSYLKIFNEKETSGERYSITGIWAWGKVLHLDELSLFFFRFAITFTCVHMCVCTHPGMHTHRLSLSNILKIKLTKHLSCLVHSWRNYLFWYLHIITSSSSFLFSLIRNWFLFTTYVFCIVSNILLSQNPHFRKEVI